MKNKTYKKTKMIQHAGWTLIELMVAIVILMILAVISYPTYQNYIVRAGRTDVQTTMIRIAQNLENYKLANNHSYAGATLTNNGIYGSTKLKSSGIEIYDLTLSTTANTWTLRAVPMTTSRQAGDGDVVLNELGQRCWVKGATGASACTPSGTTYWTK